MSALALVAVPLLGGCAVTAPETPQAPSATAQSTQAMVEDTPTAGPSPTPSAAAGPTLVLGAWTVTYVDATGQVVSASLEDVAATVDVFTRALGEPSPTNWCGEPDVVGYAWTATTEEAQGFEGWATVYDFGLADVHIKTPSVDGTTIENTLGYAVGDHVDMQSLAGLDRVDSTAVWVPEDVLAVFWEPPRTSGNGQIGGVMYIDAEDEVYALSTPTDGSALGC